MKQERLDKFTFCEPKGAEPLDFPMDFVDVGFTGRRSKLGQDILCFPPPYQDIEIVEGERVSQAKYDRIRAALADLKARATSQPSAESASAAEASDGDTRDTLS